MFLSKSCRQKKWSNLPSKFNDVENNSKIMVNDDIVNYISLPSR